MENIPKNGESQSEAIGVTEIAKIKELSNTYGYSLMVRQDTQHIELVRQYGDQVDSRFDFYKEYQDKEICCDTSFFVEGNGTSEDQIEVYDKDLSQFWSEVEDGIKSHVKKYKRELLERDVPEEDW